MRFIELLENHPYFEVTHLGASKRSAGHCFANICKWRSNRDMPASVRDLVVQECVPELFKNVDIVFSGLDSKVAGEVETAMSEYGIAVFSNAMNHRMDANVPLVAPFVNAHHMDALIPKQNKKGFIVTNPNCTTNGLVTALKPLHDAFHVEAVVVSTMQAVSGAGYGNLDAVTMIDNVVPYIGGEEEKVETEPSKILATVSGDTGELLFDDIAVSAHCNRVNVTDGHTETVSIRFAQEGPRPSPEEIETILSAYSPPIANLGLPSCPDKTIVVRQEENRPQPRFDRDCGNGFTLSVGRVRDCPILDTKLVLVSHNTIAGAAGGSILNAEYCVAKNLIPSKN